MRIRTLTVIAGLLALLAGCARPDIAGPSDMGTASNEGPSGQSAAAPSHAPTITGTITEVQTSSILVEEQPGAEMGGRKIVFTIAEDTRVFARTGAEFRPIAGTSLTVGTRVQAWAEGVIAESYPEQAKAGTIVVVDEGHPHVTPAADRADASSHAEQIPNRQPDIVGTITATEGGILVEQQPGATIGNKIVFQLNDTTRIFHRVGDDLQATQATDLMVGQRVEAWSSGGVATSYPGQAGADVIVITYSTPSAVDLPAAPPDRAPDLGGTITQVGNTVWIDGRTVLFIKPTTQFLRRSGDTFERIDANEIAEGQQASVWVDALRYAPQPQADAVAIVVTDR